LEVLDKLPGIMNKNAGYDSMENMLPVYWKKIEKRNFIQVFKSYARIHEICTFKEEHPSNLNCCCILKWGKL
jgi:hypothetical protein